MKYADDFSQSLSLDPPNIPVQVSANPRTNIFVNDLEHPITIEDIGVTRVKNQYSDTMYIRTLT